MLSSRSKRLRRDREVSYHKEQPRICLDPSRVAIADERECAHGYGGNELNSLDSMLLGRIGKQEVGGAHQNSIDFSNELHSNRQRGFGNTAAIFEVVGYVIIVCSWTSKNAFILAAGFSLVGGRRLAVVAFLERVALGSRLVSGVRGHGKDDVSRDEHRVKLLGSKSWLEDK